MTNDIDDKRDIWFLPTCFNIFCRSVAAITELFMKCFITSHTWNTYKRDISKEPPSSLYVVNTGFTKRLIFLAPYNYDTNAMRAVYRKKSNCT